MVEIVLTFDPTLGYNFHWYPLLSFAPCAPVRYIPGPIFSYLSLPDSPADPTGRALVAPYSIRKIQAALLKEPKLNVAVAHPKHVSNFIRADTRIIALTTMDPLGIGPLSLMFNNGGREKSWVTQKFEEFIQTINSRRKEVAPKAKLIVGGYGEWEFEQMPEKLEEYGIDYAIQGEVDDIITPLFRQIMEGKLDEDMFFQGYKLVGFTESGKERIAYVKDPKGKFICRSPKMRKKYPLMPDIPTIVEPAVGGAAEIMRGCGIGCDFCEVTLRPLRYYSPEMVAEEVKVNLRAGLNHAWLITDNLWAYRLNDPEYRPNKEEIFKLFRAIMSVDGVVGSNPMHATIAPVVADPDVALGVSKIVRAGPDNHIGVQIGLETGSDELIKKHAKNKALPFKIGVDASWAEIVIEGHRILNAGYWIPANTIILGQSGETDDDNWDTVGLINTMAAMGLYFTVTPMCLVNLGMLRSEKRYDVYANLTPSQAALIYACWRNTKRMADILGYKMSKKDPFFRALTTSIIRLGARIWLSLLEKYLKKLGPAHKAAVDKAKTYKPLVHGR